MTEHTPRSVAATRTTPSAVSTVVNRIASPRPPFR